MEVILSIIRNYLWTFVYGPPRITIYTTTRLMNAVITCSRVVVTLLLSKTNSIEFIFTKALCTITQNKLQIFFGVS